MSTEQVTIWPLVNSVIGEGSIIAAYGPMRGGYIFNPLSAADQNLAVAETLYMSIAGPASLAEDATTIAIPPGESRNFPPGLTGPVWVNAQSPGHRFTGVVYQPTANFQASQQSFPPAALTSLLQTLPQYLYEQYADDQNLLGFVQAFNEIAQQYMDYYNTLNLPDYTQQQGIFLDWVAKGLYGLARPLLPSGLIKTIGPYNTTPYNTIPYNELITLSPGTFYNTTDDVFKRILTWYLWRGDGFQFNVRWIKRRVERFLTGDNGNGGQSIAGDPSKAEYYPPDRTYDISVTFGVDGEININLQTIQRMTIGGALYNFAPYNAFAYNDLQTVAVSLDVNPLVPIFKAAVDSGALAFPFQLTPIVNIN